MSDPRIRIADAVSEEDRRTLSGLLAAVDIAVQVATGYPLPVAGVVYRSNADIEDAPEDRSIVLVCPWCDTEVDETSAYVLEYGQAHTYADEVGDSIASFDFRTDRFDGSEEDNGITHEPCGLPFALPDDWHTDYH